MTHVADKIDNNTHAEPPRITPADLRAYITALPRKGWTPAKDLALVEDLLRGGGAITPHRAERWRALTRPFATMDRHHRRHVTLDGQRMVLDVLRGMAG